MLRTLAAKHRSSVPKMTARHRARIQTPSGLRTCFEAVVPRQGRKPLVARFGGIPLRRNRNAVPCDRVPDPAPHRHREIIRRLLRSKCEICGRNAIRVTRTRSPESSLRGNSHGEFGGRPRGKGPAQAGTSPRGRPYVPEFQPLLRDLDLAGWVLTMDAGHTVRSHATFISGELLAHFISDRKKAARKACSSGWMPWTGHRSRHAQERRDRARAQGDQDHPGPRRAR